MACGVTPRVCFATGTRADWGLLQPVAAELRRRARVEVCVLATNMHLSERYGHTVDEIEAAGFDIAARVPMDAEADSECARVRAMAECMAGTSDALERLRPDCMVLLGDRYEMLAVASAAAMMRIPIAHLHGGEVTYGAVDDSLRHAITKLSTLHLTATEDYRRRVIQLGEDPGRVVNTGAIGVWNLAHQPLMSREELEADLCIPAGRLFTVATFHPATLDPADPAERCRAMLDALDRFPDLHTILTYPNNDARSAGIIDLIEQWAAAHPERVTLRKSLGMRRYLSAVTHAAAVVGNSSSGIVEVPSSGTPTVNIGIRQAGRTAARSVIHCGDSAGEIADAIKLALSPAMQELAARRENPYARPDTLTLIADAVEALAFERPGTEKHFYDIR